MAFGFTSMQSLLICLGTMTFGFIVFHQALKALTIYALTRFSKLREFTIGSRLLSSCLHQPYGRFLQQSRSERPPTTPAT